MKQLTKLKNLVKGAYVSIAVLPGLAMASTGSSSVPPFVQTLKSLSDDTLNGYGPVVVGSAVGLAALGAAWSSNSDITQKAGKVAAVGAVVLGGGTQWFVEKLSSGALF